jgi:hypothetical protein
MEIARETIQDDQLQLYRVTATLVINQVKAEDAGDYICSSSNSAGDDEDTFTLDVQCKCF